MKLYGLKNCDTCKKALKALEAAGKRVTFIDIRTETDLPVKVPTWLVEAGADKLVNRRSTTWRGLSDADKEGDPLPILIEYPTLIKRPVIERGKSLFVGWGKDVSEQLT